MKMAWLGVLFAIAVLMGCTANAAGSQNPNSAPPAGTGGTVEIRMTFKNFEIEPANITVKKGERVRLLITAQEATHGIAIPEFGVNQPLDNNQTNTVEFTANKTGTFPMFCNIFCGQGHRQMRGNVIVTE